MYLQLTSIVWFLLITVLGLPRGFLKSLRVLIKDIQLIFLGKY